MPRIRERAPGLYEITASTGRRDPATGKYGQVSRTVKGPPRRPGAKGFPKVVETEGAKLMAEVEGGRHQAGRHTLGDLLDEYLRHQEARGRAPKTMLEARRRADRIRADPIGAKDVRRLNGRDLDEFYARLASAGGRSGYGMHPTTRHHFHSLIRAALNQAIRWRWLSPPNPASEAQAPPLAPDERVPPTPEEARRLALAVSQEHPDLAALIFVDATTGMRRGEICGLRFCDIDIEAGAATIWWRCSDLPKDQTAALEGRGSVLKAFPNGVVMLSATKNKKRRRFALDPITLAVLLEQKARARRTRRGSRCGPRPGRLCLVPVGRSLRAVAPGSSVRCVHRAPQPGRTAPHLPQRPSALLGHATGCRRDRSSPDRRPTGPRRVGPASHL